MTWIEQLLLAGKKYNFRPPSAARLPSHTGPQIAVASLAFDADRVSCSCQILAQNPLHLINFPRSFVLMADSARSREMGMIGIT